MKVCVRNYPPNVYPAWANVPAGELRSNNKLASFDVLRNSTLQPALITGVFTPLYSSPGRTY